MNKNKYFLILICMILSTYQCLPSLSFDLESPAFSLNADIVPHGNDEKKINDLLDSVESVWNNHDLSKLNSFYSDDFINGDGLSFDSIQNLTKDLWEAYPDVMSKSTNRHIRVFGEYATVDSTDLYEGNSSKIRDEVGTKGVLKAVSIGQLFLKKFGPKWKITSDKTLFEKVSIGYGQGIELIDANKIRLNTPEQVPGAHQYTARLEFDLPKDIKPVASLSKEVLIYPQVNSEDKFRLTNESKLEKWIISNNIGKNELITATIGLTGEALRPQLVGLVFLTKRVNIIPVNDENGEVSIIKTPAKSALNRSVELLDTYNDHDDFKKKDKKTSE